MVRSNSNMSSYKRKQLDAESRCIPFELTEQEFIKLKQIRDLPETRCAYTNKVFVKRENHPHYPSLERIDPNGPYSIDNVLWVTTEANLVKDVYIDKHIKTLDRAKEVEIQIYNQISKLFVDPNWTKVLWQKQIGKHLQVPEQVVSLPEQNTEVVIAQHSDVSLTETYLKFANLAKSVPVEFSLSFVEFKQIWNRKRCQLTLVPLDDNMQKVVYCVDKTLGFTKGNCLLTSTLVQETLDNMFVKTKMTNKQWLKVFEKLSKN